MLLRPLGHATADEGTAPPRAADAHDGPVATSAIVPFEGLPGLGPFFVLERDPAPGSTDLAALIGDPAVTDAVIDRYAERLATTRRDIAGSLFLQGWASRVASVHAGCLALGGGVPDLGPANLRFHFPDVGPVELTVGDPALRPVAGGWRQLVDGHLAPLIGAVDDRSGPGARRLWGNVASALAGALVALGRRGHGIPAEFTPMPAELTDYGDWITAGAGVRYVRRTCCNLFRVEGYGVCGDCVILRGER